MPPPRLLTMSCLAFALALAREALAAGVADTVARRAAQLLAQPPASSVVVASPLASDQPAPRGDELALRIAALVAGRIGASAQAHAQTAQLATARAIAGRASALVFVQAEIGKGDLRLTIDVYPSMSNAWDRIRNPLPSPTSHAFASEKIDAEVRSYLTPLALEQADVHRVRHQEGNVLAAACGDVDGDGGNEIVLVSRMRVVMGRLRDGQFDVERSAAWSALGGASGVAMRNPLAGAVVAPGAVEVGSTDRGGLSLTADFLGHAPLSGIPAWGTDGIVCLMPQPSAGAFDGAPLDCAVARELKPRMAVPVPRFDVLAAATLADVHGSSHAVVVVREPSGKLWIKMEEAPAFAAEGTFGAQVALADLDQDGAPEIASSNDGGAEDAIHVWTLPSPATAGDWRERFSLPAPAGVRALAVCPPEEHGEPALVAVVGDELWLVRAAFLPASRESTTAARP